MRITINPGHGPKNQGYDPGALGSSLKEVDQNMQIAELIKQKLQANGHEIFFIQDGDLWDVTNQSNAWRADYFISIHCNSFADPSAHGIETYFYKPGGKGEIVAKAVQAELIKATGLTDRGAKAGNLHVVRETNCPAILVEAGFISNPNEEALMNTAEFDEKVAEAICVGFSKVLGLSYSTTKQNQSEGELEAVKAELQSVKLELQKAKQTISEYVGLLRSIKSFTDRLNL